MNDIFGIPMNGIAVVLSAFLALCLLSVLWIAWRRTIIFKLGIRNMVRRKTQTTLIVVGLALSTLIIAAALGTGDTIDNSITSDVYSNLGQVDELIVTSQVTDTKVDLTSQQSLPPNAFEMIDRSVAGDPNIDGVLPMLETRLPVLNDAGQLAEADVVVTGLDPDRVSSFGGLIDTDGKTIDLSQLASDQVVVSAKLAGQIDATVGTQLTLHVGDTPHQFSVAAIAKDTYLSGTRRSRDTYLEYAGLTMPLGTLQTLLDRPGEISVIALSNTGNSKAGGKLTDEVVTRLEPAFAGHGLGIDTIKQDRVDDAELIGSNFTSIFVVLSMFSVISGVLLIILIFTMLASERRTEMGIERAIGTQRRQLIHQFVAEGAGYSFGAGLIGVTLGALAAIGIAQGMKIVFGSYAPIEAHVTPRSLLVAYTLGMAITFLTVVAASWKISRVNIVAAVRDIPDVVSGKRKWSTLIWAGLLTLVGVLMALMGSGGSSAEAFSVGMTFAPLGLVLFLRYFGLPGRLLYTAVGLYTVGFWMMPQSTFKSLFGEFDFGIAMFFLSGIFAVVGATIVILQNNDILLAGVSRLGGLFRSKLPAVRTAVAYPSAARGRTGLTIAMFSLIIFSLVLIATMNANFLASALGDEANAGWDVRAEAVTSNPPSDFVGTLQQQGVDTSQFESVGVVTNPDESSSEIRMAGAEEWKIWPVLGVDQQFIDHSEIVFGQRAVGYATDADIMQALATQPNVAVIDAFAVPAEGDLGSDGDIFSLTGLKSGEEVFDPITVELQNPKDGSAYSITIIGVIDSKIGSLFGLYANQQTIDAIYPSVTSTSWVVSLKDPNASGDVAKSIESALLTSSVQATSIRDDLRDQQKEESGFLYIIEGFMGLGLFVGIAAVGVIAFRSVVERRQQIGVLRAIGFQREMVSLSFMIESLFIVGLGVFSGAILGLQLAHKMVLDPNQGFSSDISFVIPWTTIMPILVVTILVSMLMTWIPAQQAGRIAPAEALRYE
jgi:putative ABC transport system permease protein